jgi:hypothetical protein
MRYAKTKTFQRDKRTNASVPETSQPSVIYEDADNENHTKIYETGTTTRDYWGHRTHPFGLQHRVTTPVF